MKHISLIIGFTLLFFVPLNAQLSDNIDFVSSIEGFNGVPKIDLANNVLYVGDGSILKIYDVSAPSSPAALGSLNIASTINDIEFHTYFEFFRVYLACNDGFHIIDVTDPASPYQIGFLAGTYGFEKLVLRNYSEAWLIGDYPNIKIINFYPDPSLPEVVATANFDGYPLGYLRGSK